MKPLHTFVAGLLGLAASAPAATLVADYQVQGTYVSSVGTIGPLVPSSTEPNAIGFVADTVRGNPQTVVRITAGTNAATTPLAGDTAGLIAQTNGFVSSTNYSAVLLADFTLSANLLATKVMDFKNGSADAGLYVNSATGLLAFNGVTPTPPIGGTPVVTGAYTQIVLTRDGATNLVSVYQEGAPAFSFTDTAGLAILGDATASGNAFFTVFKDDAANIDGGVLTTEDTQGDVARLRLYDGVLTPAEVSTLTTVIPEPSSLAALAAGGVAVLRRRRA